MSRVKFWCFTLNNYSATDPASLAALVEAGTLSYVCWGAEVSASGTPHLQGYLESATRLRLSALKKLGPLDRAHLEARAGSQEQAIDYCHKKGKQEEVPLIEYGTKTDTSPGDRSDLSDAVTALREGASIRDLWLEHTETMVRYSRGLSAAHVQLAPNNRPRTTFDLSTFPFHDAIGELDASTSHHFVGLSGIGKTSYLRSRYPGALIVSHMDDLTRFVPDEHEAIIFDDMSFSHMPRSAQIHILDVSDDRSIHVRYQTAFIPAGTLKFFTSNYEDIFLTTDRAINRRLTVHRIRGEPFA